MRLMKFYDADSPSGSANQSTVELVFDGEVVDTLELPEGTPEEVKLKIKQGMEKGLLYNKKMHSIAEAERDAGEYRRFKGLINDVAEGRKEPEVITKAFEEYGIKLTKGQQDDIASGDLDFVDEKVNAKIQSLESKIQTLEKQNLDRQSTDLANEIGNVHKALAEKYNGKDGYPKYDSEAVDKYIEDNKFYLPNIAMNYEMAYKALNEDKILEAEREKVLDINKGNRKKALTEKGDLDINTKLTNKGIDIKGKSWSEVTQAAIDNLDESDLFSED